MMKKLLSILFCVSISFMARAQSPNNQTTLFEWNVENVGVNVGERVVATINIGAIGPYTGVGIVGQIVDGNGNWGYAMPIVANFKMFAKLSSPAEYKIEQDVVTPNIILSLKSLSANQLAIVANCPNPNRQVRVFFRYTTGFDPGVSLASSSLLSSPGTMLVAQPSYRTNLNGKLTIINDTDPSDYALAVGGKAIAESITVKLRSAWPDYVFAKDYSLPSLAETEKHIMEKGHLPGLPSAAEVKSNGIDLGEMNAKLLQKIEELTLHLIEKEKTEKNHEQEIRLLKQQVAKIINQINQ